MKKRSKESGQAVVEYIVLISITLGVVVLFAKRMTDLFDSTSPKMGGIFEKQLRGGGASAALWEE